MQEWRKGYLEGEKYREEQGDTERAVEQGVVLKEESRLHSERLTQGFY